MDRDRDERILGVAVKVGPNNNYSRGRPAGSKMIKDIGGDGKIDEGTINEESVR
jgi:hypothetical protein